LTDRRAELATFDVDATLEKEGGVNSDIGLDDIELV